MIPARILEAILEALLTLEPELSDVYSLPVFTMADEEVQP